MGHKLLIFDSHPVQYRVPIWQAMSTDSPGDTHVVYATDSNVRGAVDKEFGMSVKWDIPMLSGYDFTILNSENGVPLTGWNSLTGKGVKEQIERFKPDAILLLGFNYRYDATAYFWGRKLGIPLWLRCETQDYCFPRTRFKSVVRSAIYSQLYKGLDKIFYIGELNKLHYQVNGVDDSRLIPARYFTVDRFEEMSDDLKLSLRNTQRKQASIADDAVVVGFSGKFIEKKNPKILFEMQEFLPRHLQSRIHLYFVGSGELEKELRELAAAAEVKYGSKAFFSGFVNQTQLPAHYLSMDMMVLPSRKMGETWGLVTNEAMQSGAGVIVSDAVGSSVDFKQWERFRVFKEGDARALAARVEELAKFQRSFNWASAGLRNYTVEATVKAFSEALSKVG